LRCAVWFTQLGFPGNEFEFPYIARSPVTGKKNKFENLKQVEKEIQNVLGQNSVNSFGIGQTLYHELPFFTNPKYHIKQWVYDVLEDYIITTKYNVPLGKTLETIDVFTLDCFAVIEEEKAKIKEHQSKNG